MRIARPCVFLLNFLLNFIEGLACNVGEFLLVAVLIENDIAVVVHQNLVAIPLLELGIGGSRPADIVRKLPCENRRIDRGNPEVVVWSERRSEVAEIRAQRFNFGNGGLYVFAARIISLGELRYNLAQSGIDFLGLLLGGVIHLKARPVVRPEGTVLLLPFGNLIFNALFRALFVIFIKVCLVGKREVAKAVAFGNEEILRLEQFRGEIPLALVFLKQRQVFFVYVFAHVTRALVSLRYKGKRYRNIFPICQLRVHHEHIAGVDLRRGVVNRHIKRPICILFLWELIQNGEVIVGLFPINDSCLGFARIRYAERLDFRTWAIEAIEMSINLFTFRIKFYVVAEQKTLGDFFGNVK